MQVGKQLGEEWRSMSEWDKAPYNEKAAQSKSRTSVSLCLCAPNQLLGCRAVL
jgi:hypothetical protein